MWLFHLLFWIAVTASAKEALYGKIGDKAVLTPDSVVNPITSIEWKHGPDIAMEWFGGETFSYQQFKDRGTLNTLTGALTITGLTRDDSGNYTAEINGKVTTKTQLLVISPVSKPTLSVWCEPEMTYCVFTCNGSTTGAEPVTYNWRSGDIKWSSTKEHNVTEEDNELWFSCAFENPVSFSSSEQVFNPFMEKEPLYKEIGDKAVLTPVSVVNPTSIVWKQGPDIAMEWFGDEIVTYRQFKDRGTLNTLTGALTITGLTRDDSGNYTAEINDKVNSKTQLLVISPVSKPTVSEWCAMTYCVFTCSGSTTGAEPVTYWWTSGDTTWSSTKEQKITMREKELWFSWLSCASENPVSIISSEQVFNPFIRNLIISITVLFLVLCIIIIIIIYFRHRGIIYFIHKGRYDLLIWMFIFTPVFMMVVFIIMINLIYEDIKEKAAERGWPELQRWTEELQRWIEGDDGDGTEEELQRRIEELERRRNELERWTEGVQNTSTQDPTSVVTPDTSNGTEMTEMLPLVQKTSTQDPTSVVTPDTSNETGASTISEVHKTPNQDLETADSPDPSNETKKSEMIPDDLAADG